MTADETLSDEDDVTLAADGDVLAQIREEALALKRRRTAGGGKTIDAAGAADEIVVWSADNDSFDPSLDETVALTNSPAPAPVPKVVPTVVPNVHDDESLIGNAPPPASSASYFEGSETSTSVPEPITSGPPSRPRVPLWLLLVLVAIVIIGVSVAVALLVASGASA